MARHLRGMRRHWLAAQVGIPTTQLREYERTVRNQFEQHPDYGIVQTVPIPLHLAERICEVIKFPIKWLFQYADPIDDAFMTTIDGLRKWWPIFGCSTRDIDCLCGAPGAWYCDAVFERERPVFSDRFNRLIIDTKIVTDTCDAPVCNACATKDQANDKLYCLAHKDPKSRFRRVPVTESAEYWLSTDLRHKEGEPRK